jgi:CBS domain-containing protein
MYPKTQVSSESSGMHKGRTSLIHAKDIMTSEIVWVGPTTAVRDIAQLLSKNHISAVPVIDDDHKIVGIVTEGDLIQREELGTATSLPSRKRRGANVSYAKSHGMCASDVMTHDVVVASEVTSLAEIAHVMQSKRIKRLPVTRSGRIVGILSRSDVVQALANRPLGAGEPMEGDDDIIRFKVIDALMDMPGTSPWRTTVGVLDGVVELKGAVEDEAALEPSRVLVGQLAGVVDVRDHRSVAQPY